MAVQSSGPILPLLSRAQTRNATTIGHITTNMAEGMYTKRDTLSFGLGSGASVTAMLDCGRPTATSVCSE